MLNDLSKEVFQLDLCLDIQTYLLDKETEQEEREYANGSKNRFFSFLRALGSAQRDLEQSGDLDGQDQLRSRFQLDYVVEVLKEVKMPADSHVYKIFGNLVAECSPILFRKRNLIGEILDILIDFRSLKKEDYSLTLDHQKSIREALPSFIRGLVLVPSFRTQSFVLRLLKAIIVNYLSRFPLNEQHPLLVGIFGSASQPKGLPMANPDLEKHFFIVVKSEFLSKKRDSGMVLGFLALILTAKLGNTPQVSRTGILERMSKFLGQSLLELTFIHATDERVVQRGKDLIGKKKRRNVEINIKKKSDVGEMEDLCFKEPQISISFFKKI